LDYEDPNQRQGFSVGVRVYDGRYYATTRLRIRLEDRNDNAPVLSGPQRAQVYEDAKRGTVVAKFKVYDADANDTTTLMLGFQQVDSCAHHLGCSCEAEVVDSMDSSSLQDDFKICTLHSSPNKFSTAQLATSTDSDSESYSNAAISPRPYTTSNSHRYRRNNKLLFTTFPLCFVFFAFVLFTDGLGGNKLLDFGATAEEFSLPFVGAQFSGQSRFMSYAGKSQRDIIVTFIKNISEDTPVGELLATFKAEDKLSPTYNLT
uniref:Cadherin domain-containing protein n=2 Tax=Anisakis simplex TaxID=6269 RepID=A0A0M3K632_ANISI